MARIRGTDLSSLRTFVREKKGSQVEAELLRSLPAALQAVYLETSPVTWNPVEVQAELYERAAAFLFPTLPEAVVEMHRILSQMSYSGVYRLFIRIPSLDFIVKRAASVWGKYYDTGEATAENLTNGHLDFVVRDFPTLPRALQQATTGHLYTLMEMAGAKRVEVVSPANTPEKWIWPIRWAA